MFFYRSTAPWAGAVGVLPPEFSMHHTLIFAACGVALLWLIATLFRERRLRIAWQTLVQRLLSLWNKTHAPPDDP